MDSSATIELKKQEENIREIEDSIKRIDVNRHFPKITGEQFKTFLQGLGKNVMKDSNVDETLRNFVLFSGSFMEGAPFARMVNPTLKKEYIEFEFDMMFPVGRVIDNQHADEVVNDLEYAKGFTWVRYDEKVIELELKNGRQISEYLIEHKNGVNYLNSKAFKNDFSKDLNIKPDLSFFTKFTEEIQGPSNNVDMVFLIKKMGEEIKNSKKEDLQKGVNALDKILGFIQRVFVDLENAHQNILKLFSGFKKEHNAASTTATDDKNTHTINQLDIDEFKGMVFPVSRSNEQQQNKLLHLHWSLLAYINEIILVVAWIDAALAQTDLERLLGFWRFSFLMLLERPVKLKESLVKYIFHLVALPRKITQGTTSGVEDMVQMFLRETITKMPIEVELVLKTFQRCLDVLPARMMIMRAIACDFKDDSKFNLPNHEECCLNVDRVPAIFVQELPAVASEFKTRARVWPSPETMALIFEAGFHLVPKPSTGDKRDETLDWRWSFSKAEMILANSRTDAMDMAYLILKSIIYRYYKCHDAEEKTIPSYFAKTTMMLTCESHPEDWWTQRSVCECVVVLLEDLKTFFERGFLPHYFIYDLNLFDGLPDELVDFGRAVSQSICQDPLSCILEVVSQIMGQRKSNNSNNKTTETKGGAIRREKHEKDLTLNKERSNPMEKVFGRGGSDSGIKEETSKLYLLLAEFRVTLEEKENEYKDLPDMQGILKLSKYIYEDITTNMYREEFEKSKTIHPVYDPAWKLSFTLNMNRLQDELENTNVFSFSFRGSTAMRFELNRRT